MATIGDVSVGSVLRYNNDLCQIVEYQHRTPGNLRAFYQVKMRNLLNGKLVENRFRAGEAVDLVRVEYKTMQFIYMEGDFAICMDNETFEQVHVPAILFGEGLKFMKENMEVKVSFEGDTPITAESPTFVEAEVIYAEPGLKGDTATNTLKPCKIDTGATVMIPLFVNQGEKIKVDTRTGTYVERIK